MLKVYMLGLLYFDGCEADERHVYAPDGRLWEPLHYASFFIYESLINNTTNWWAEARHVHPIEVTGGGPPHTVQVIEFQVPYPCTISFSSQGAAGLCDDLDTKLPKLKRRMNGQDSDFVFNPATAETIAEVTMAGGEIRPRRFNSSGIVEWAITNDIPVVITATRKDGGGSRSIRLNAVDAEVVFCNIHDVFVEGTQKGNSDVLKNPNANEGHIDLFRKLNPNLGNAILISSPPTGQVLPLAPITNAFLQYLRAKAHIEGETPPCCKGGGIVGNDI